MNLLERNSEIEKDIYAINGAAIEVHKILGHGFHEKVYGDALAVEFKLRGIPFEREKHLLINYKGVALQHDFFVDFLCYDSIIVELKALDNLSLEIKKGEFVVILGPSGAGKSTLLNLLGGLDTVTSGEIIVKGNHVENFSDNQLTSYRAENVGFIFQFYNLIPNLTALENVELMKDIVDVNINGLDVLDSVGLKDHAGQFPAQLSGGEQQRVSIARAVAKQPTMLLCDEPTGALDSKTGVLILNLLQDMSNNKDTTVVIVTHNAILAEAADKVIRIKNGQIESIAVNENPKKITDLEW